ncbi:uncharacterized protein B0H64DRAFT_464367 [Chaetomium fimeti]|uniref:Carrier domain-containing protein n=1 Tax=Chaetomium fimeti TaxID=1854472 RepID=A0AAE0LPN9_9PEZI|nr:hypothetical protein B0H64DRAFT_464367 [Chaetomium fimeti]
MPAFQDPTGNKSSTTNAGGGHWLKEDVAAFDAGFFGINPVEAVAMDPQQRLLLEVAYESFENAGLSRDSLWGSNTGVFVGQWSSDYHEMMARDTENPPLYLVTGTGPAIASNRISYCFNLRGPSFTVDTGCSSSFVALHQAVQSLRLGETAQCFVGGVNLLLDPQRFHYQSRLKMFSSEGRSFSFDSRANGYGRGEGCTGVMLKPLSAALRDGDNVRAVIRSSVLNQDGRTQGITLPSGAAQREAILKAYQQAHLEPFADYVEAHGTGTKVGDPIEVGAIASVLSRGRASRRKLPIGSVKGNIGHLEGAAGLAGLIKSVLMLEKGMIPPQVNFENVNPEILLDEWNLRIPLLAEPRNLRRISVNSFGYGGTNAHVVLDAAADHMHIVTPPLRRTLSWGSTARTPRVFILSAANQSSCQKMCTRVARYLVARQPHTLGSEQDVLLSRLSYTLSKHTMLPHRVALVACDMGNLVSQLMMASSGPVPPRETKKSSRIAFIFSGQGAQYAEMGRQLLQSRPVFFRALERARSHLSHLGCTWDLVSELCRPKAESHINEPAYAQPLSTAVQMALVDLLAEFNILPASVVGHSSGEIAAAYAAGLMSFEDAMTAAYFRGKLTGELIAENQRNGISGGAMIAVGASATTTEQHISKVGEQYGRMRVACINSPASVTVSGDAAAVEQLAGALEAEGIFNRKLMTNGAAYHSHQMEALASEYATRLGALKPFPAGLSTVRMFSSVTGQDVGNETELGGEYWVQNLLSPVLFSQAVKLMSEERYDGEPIDTIVEVGSHSQLGGPVKQILKARSKGFGEVAYTHTLKRGSDAEESLLRCLGFLCIQGSPVTAEALNDSDNGHHPGTPALLPDLPPYPFDHSRRFWHDSRLSRDYQARPHLPHELLGTLSIDVNHVEPRWRRFLNLKEIPWLRKHIVQGQIVFPGAGFLTMAVQAARQHSRAMSPTAYVEAIVLRNINIGKALVLSEDEANVEIALSLRPQARTARESSSLWNEFRIFSIARTGQWTEHCRGLNGPTYDVFVCREGDELTGDEMILHAEGVQLTALPGDVGAGRAKRELCYDTEWITYSQTWTPQHLERICKSAVPAESVATRNRILQALSIHHVQRALRELSMEDIPEGSYLRRLFEWMQMLANEEYDASLIATEDGSSMGAFGEAILRMGPCLGEILNQKTDPLGVLMPGNLLSRLYADDRRMRCNLQIAAWCKELGLQKPGLRVLEIGAGTASTTVPVLGALHGRVGRYDFTDLTSTSFENAKQRLGNMSDSVDFKILNIGNNPREQGFEEASYDLILASNVHATRRINEMLENQAAEAALGKTTLLLSQNEARLGPVTLSVQELGAPPLGGGIVVVLPEVGTLLRENVDANSWRGFKSWVLSARAVVLVSQESGADATDPGVAGLWLGFARCLRLEHPEIRIVTLQLQHARVPMAEKLSEILPTLLGCPTFNLGEEGPDVENEFAERDGQLFVPRLVSRPEITDHIYRSGHLAEPELTPFLHNGRTLAAELGVPGLMETFRWKDDKDAPSVGADDIKIELRAASVNFKDVLIAAGQLEGITEMRNDCSGVVVEVGANMLGRFKPGDRVCALYSRSYTNYPVVHGDCCQVLPDSMSFEEGASLPIVWSTVYYSLVELGRLKRGDKLLIHSAAGAVGQAAIMLAQHLGAEVFVTVGNSAKRELLQNTYGIPPDHIFSSRTTAFHGAIKRLTGGYGVDVVLNSLGGELFRESCNLVAHFGRFVEIGRKDLMDDALMPMGFLLKNVTFAYVELTGVMEHNKPLARHILRSVADLASAGHIRAVPLTVLPMSEIETAFRLIQGGKHTGKVILKVEQSQQVKAVPPAPIPARLKADATYAVVGGFGGLGRAVLLWMVSHGARYIVALSRSGAKDQESQSFIQEMNAKGVSVVGKACDIASEERVASIPQEIELEGMPPIRGIVQSAMVLKDTLFEHMTEDDWNLALMPKVRGTVNLETILGEDLDFFVILSSVVSVWGNIGQCNYAAGCGFQDSLAHQRVGRGRAGYSINVCPVSDVGYVSEHAEVAEALRRTGMGEMSAAELLTVVDHSVKHPLGGGCVISGLAPPNSERGSGESWMRKPLFAHLARRDAGGAQRQDGETSDIATLLGAAQEVEEAVEIISEAILQQLGKLMATPAEMLSATRNLDSYGVDSLVAVELRSWIGAYLGANVQLLVLRGASSINALAKIVAKESRLVCFE